MKIVYLLSISLITFSLKSQVYKVEDFGLSGSIKKVSVLSYNLYEEDGEYVENFPILTNTSYKTDLNLHYLEFYSDGLLKKSKLFYPRDFYGQFSHLPPILDLESSDFGENINYLTKSYIYNYTKEENLLKVTLSESNNTNIRLIFDNDFMVEDEYYNYSLKEYEDKKVLTKKRKESQYGYRRLEEITNDNRTVINEYINNRFIVSKELILVQEGRIDTIKVSQSKINLEKSIYNTDGLLINKSYMDLSWRNKFRKWPEIDFDESYNYDSYISNLERNFTEYNVEYTYDENGYLKEKREYRLDNNEPQLISTDMYTYNKDGALELQFENDKYREYQYDSRGNWVTKIVGNLEMIDGISMRVPYKKYVRTLTYWN